MALPGPVAEVIAEIESATERLRDAARAASADEIRTAVETRGQAVQRFQDLMADYRESLDAGQRDELLRLRDEVFEAAGHARDDLLALVTDSRKALEFFKRGVRAVRGYHELPHKVPSLDRSG